MNRKLIISLLILVIPVLEALSQYVSEDITQINTTPPTLSELGKYVDTPVGLYTGVPEINIPLYTIQEGKLSIPIALSYHSSGIKVQQRASWVGLGWSLNAGGAITRVINGRADDRNLYDTYYGTGLLYRSDPSYDGYGYASKDQESDLYYFSFPGHSGMFYFDSNGEIHIEEDQPYEISFTPALSEILNKPQSYNDGITGFTILTDDGTKYTFDLCERTTSVPTYPNVVDAPLFYKDLSLHCEGFSLNDSVYKYSTNTSAWHLTKIEFPDQADSVTFEYDNFKYSNLERTGQVRKYGALPPMTRQEWINTPGYLPPWDHYQSYNYSLSLINGYRLQKINWSLGSASFIVDEEDRLDIDNQTYHSSSAYNPDSIDVFTSEEKRLGEVIIKNNNLDTIKSYHLGYDYFFSVEDSTNFYDDLGCSWTKNHLFYRLRLDTVYESSPLGNHKPPYLFEYNEDELPYRYSNAVDYWGYYNGRDTNSCQIPTIYIYPQMFFNYDTIVSNETYFKPGGIDTTLFRSIFFPFEMPVYDNNAKQVWYGEDNTSCTYMMDKNFIINIDYTLDSLAREPIIYSEGDQNDLHVTILGSDRSVDTSASDAFILKKITYPTGGYSTFNYEANEYLLKGEEAFGGGIRIKQIDSYDPVSTNSVSKIYTYDDENGISSGRIQSFPLFAANNFDYPAQLNDFSGDLILYRIRDFPASLTECQENMLDYFDFESLPDPASGDEMWYYYYLWSVNPDNIIMHSASQVELGTSKGSYVGYQNVTVDYYGNGKEEYTYEYSGSMEDRNDTIYAMLGGIGFCENDSIPFSGETSDYYPFPPNRSPDWNRGQVKSIKVFDSEDNLIKLVNNQYTMKMGSPVEQLRLSYGDFGNPDLFMYYQKPGWKYLSQTEEILYDPADSNKEISTITKTTRNDEHLLSRKAVWNSHGDSLITYMLYPKDYRLVLGNQTIMTMRSSNIINRPIEVMEMVNDRIVSAKYNKFTILQGVPVLSEIYDVKNDTPIDSSSFIGLDDMALWQTGTQYSREFVLEHDEESYKLISAAKEDDVEVSYVWGYKDNYPIAQIANSGPEESYHTSFEEEAGWTTWGGSYDTIVIHSGKQTRKITKQSSELVYNFLEPENWLDFRNVGAGTYLLSGWVYSDEPTAQLFLFKKTDLDKTDYYSNITTNYINTTQTGKWVYLEIEAEITSDVNYVYFRIDSNGESGSVWFDDIRFHPLDAQMTTFTYDPLRGMTSQTDPNGRAIYYEYDDFGRLEKVRDNDGNIMEEYEYNYANQQ